MDDELVRPDLAAEHLRSLQDALDGALEREGRLRARVQKLETDRDVLRERLEDARELARRRTLRGRLTSSPASERPAEPPKVQEEPGEALTAELPVVGTLGPLSDEAPVPRRTDVLIGLVADAFTTEALRHECPLLELRAGDAGIDHLRRERPDLLLVESAYGGSGGTWTRRIARFGEPSDDLRRLVESARELDIPTVFWNKEDPVNTDWFLASARLFDVVLTVDGNLVDEYRRRLGHDRVDVLPFAAQPAIHRPPASPDLRTGPVLFAGTWFANKHASRRDQMEYLLDPARQHGLQILDRHAGSDPRFQWPERFRPHIVGSLPYRLAVEATRRFKVVVNVNTVTDSPTMCARRIFELAACATPVVSGPARSLGELVPSDAVWVVHDREEAAAAYAELLGSPTRRAAMGEAALAWVSEGHTWAHRLDHVLAIARGTGAGTSKTTGDGHG